MSKSTTVSSISNQLESERALSPPVDQIDDQTTAKQQQNDENSKIYEMNTYVQLEIDNNNALCVPRTCKFTIKKLVIKKDLIQQLLEKTTSLTSNLNQPQQGINQQQQSNSLIIAIKLNIAKRILRTIELPLNKLIKSQQQQLQNDVIVLNLNLFYNISYSHYLKKNTNFLYIYIQRRKKYKNRTILGFKTLSFAKIDLQSIMQRTYNVDLLLETMSSQSSSAAIISNQTNNHYSSSINNKYSNSIMMEINAAGYDINQLQQQYGNQISGYLTINSLSSHSFDYQTNSDHEQQQQQQQQQENAHLNNNRKCQNNDELEGIDDDDIQPTTTIVTNNIISGGNPLTNVLANLASKNKALNTALNSLTNRSTNSDSDVELPNESASNANLIKVKQRGANKQRLASTSGNNKKFTGKLISFIRKLRINDDSPSSTNRNASPIILNKQKSANNTINEDIEEIISDFSDNNNSIGSASDIDIDTDLYSIISTPKPSLQPFFKPISSNQDNKEQSTVEKEDSDSEQSLMKIINSEFLFKNLDSLLLTSHNNQTPSPIEVSYYLTCDLNFYNKLKDSLNNLYLLNLNDLQLSQQRDIRCLFETLIVWFNKNKQQLQMNFNKKYQQFYYFQQQQQQQQNLVQIKVILFGNDQFLNQFLRVYVELFKTQDLLNLFKFYYIPYYNNNNITATYHLARGFSQFDALYQSLFGDEYWLQLDSNLQINDIAIQRIQRFIKYSSQSYVQLQICEVMLNYIDGTEAQNENEVTNDNANSLNENIPFICDVKIGGGHALISNSCTVDQLIESEQIINNPLSSSPSHNIIKEDSPPNSPHPCDDLHEYELQVDYWTTSNQSTTTTTTTTIPASLVLTPSSTIITSTVSSLVQNQLSNAISSNQSGGNQQQQSNKENQPSTNSSKITKSTTKGVFKYLLIATNSCIQNTGLMIHQYGNEVYPTVAHNLSMTYAIKEKKKSN